ncbi:MAG TPA: GAF domain-containing sensor histidine kinase, partial [Candidatus Nitrosotenuis sp.]|nr:GAF domain-containing sensor histidine kinase [Candidatus Nitrosotenuis sp.]
MTQASSQPGAPAPSLTGGIARLLEITRSITRVLELDRLLQLIIDAAMEVSSAERGCLMILRPGPGAPQVERYVYGRTSPDRPPLEFVPSLRVVEQVTSTRQGVHETDALARGDPSRSMELARLRSILCEPLIVRDQVIGVLYVDSQISHLFSDDHRELLRSFAAQAAVCIENARLFAEVQEESRRRLEEEMKARELEARRDAMAAFVSIAAHDLKNPLTVIKGGIYLLRRQGLTPAGEEVVESMERSLQRAMRLVQTYLDAVCLEDGRELELSTSALEVGPVVRRELELLRARLPANRPFEFEVQVPEGLRVQADESRLEQILGNLLDNAVKYSPSGGRVDVRAYPCDGEVAIEVSDSGVGLAPESMGRLFLRYSRVGDTRATTGTGLGLWITRRLVESQGGKIEAESRPGGGSTFRFTLPRAR